MRSKVGQSVSQSLGGVGLAGGSLMLRLRRASIALLALVGVVGLGLIVFISQLGWPDVASGPLPGAPSEKVGKLAPGVALAQQPSPPSIATGVPAGNGGATGKGGARGRSGKASGRHGSDESGVGGPRELGTTNGGAPGTGSGQPVSQPASQPTGTRTPAPIPASPTVAAAGNNSSSAAGSAKATNDGSRATSVASSKSPKTAGSGSSSPTSSAGPAAAKAQNDEGAAATSTPPPAPAPPPASPAASKEAADAAR